MTWVRERINNEGSANYKLSGKCNPPPEVLDLFRKYNGLRSTCDWYLYTSGSKKVYSVWDNIKDFGAFIYYKKPNYTIKSVGKVV